jgi:SAM-dependent methyltransferase
VSLRRRAGQIQGQASGSSAGKTRTTTTGQPCGSLGRVLARVFRESHPEVLDLGPLCGQTVVYLAQRGARVHVEPFEPPRSVPPAAPGEPAPEAPPIRLDHPDGKFDLVLAWEHFDFVPPERVPDFAREIRRVLRDGGSLFLLSRMSAPKGPERPVRYRVLADDMIARESTRLPARPRWTSSTRDIERALAGFSIEGVHLQRNQMREFAAIRV